MSGTIGQQNGSIFVRWWSKTLKRDFRIYHYKGMKLGTESQAYKLLSQMQGDKENGTFYIEKYVKKGFSDVVPFIENWLENIDGLSAATYKGYKSYIKNHIKPFFQYHNQLTMPDIQIDILRKFRKSLEKKELSPIAFFI